MKKKCVLFDLDGTLADSAPDLVLAANQVRQHYQLPPLPFELLRPYASRGSRGLLGKAMGTQETDPDYPTQQELFLNCYEQLRDANTVLFDGIALMFQDLERHHYQWGIVTNKASRFAPSVVARLGLQPQCLVCGDTTPTPKPHPEPILYACRQMQCLPEDVVYLGDDIRDFMASNAAGSLTVAVAWGYLPSDVNLNDYRIDCHLTHPSGLMPWLLSLAATA